MSQNVYILGAHTTPFKRWPDKTHKQLTQEAYVGVLADAGLLSGKDITGVWFGTCLSHYWGQHVLRGQMLTYPLVRDGLLPDRVPLVNVEGGCATGSIALAGAYKEIRAGDADLTLAMGVEKCHDPVDPARMRAAFDARDAFDPAEWLAPYYAAGDYVGTPFVEAPDRTLAMDTYAMQALVHMKMYGTTQRQIAVASAKNHCHGALNPNAQYQFEMTPEQVLADRVVSQPLTRAMCSPMGDGAAAVLLCSQRYLRNQPREVQDRAVRIAGFGMSGGKYRMPGEPGLTRFAAGKAYRQSGRSARDIQVAEVHDATSFCEIFQSEMLGFCADGEGGAFIESGATTLGGSLPVNTSGGLVSKGHPIAATGLSMCQELVTQLRGEAGARQVQGASVALQENGGGIMGLEEAVAAVMVYERA